MSALLPLALFAQAPGAGGESKFTASTRVSISGHRWLINDRVTYRGTPAEGLLMNVRMVNAVFEDANARTRLKGFDANANTNAFIARIRDYVAHGVCAFTLNLQGGHCGYEGAVNSAFNADGSLRQSYLQRVRRVIEACDRHGAVVILGCFYQRQDQILRDEHAVRAGVVNVIRWLRDTGCTNVLLEIANEFGHRGYDHPILKSASGQAELITLARRTAPGLLVATSGLGDGRAADEVVRAGDFTLIHFNDTKLDGYAARLAALQNSGKPIVCNEDDKIGERGAAAARACVAQSASWGFMHSALNQYFPLAFKGGADDPTVYATLRQLTTPRHFPGEHWEEVAPEAEGVDSAKLKAAVALMDATFGREGARELVIVRHGRLIWAGPDADAYHPIFSCTKTFTSAVLGSLVDDGKCALDDPAVKHLPELDDAYPLYARIELRHLASMSGGYHGEVIDKRPDQRWGDVMAYFNPREPYFEAGTHVQYNDHDVFILGKILTLLIQEPLQDFFQRRIAGPIGIKRWEWGVSGTVDGIALNNPPGNPGGSGAGGIKISAREFARFGLLMLNRGQWKGRPLLSAAYVDEATTNQIPLTGGFRNRDFRGRYGFYWWTNGVAVDGKRPWPAAPSKTYYVNGAGANFCVVVPEWDLVLVRMGSPSSVKDPIWDAFFKKLAAAVVRGRVAQARPEANDTQGATVANQEQQPLVQDPLSSAEPVSGEESKRTVGGRYSARGWSAAKNGDKLVIELAGADGFEGALEVDVSDLDWRAANGTAGDKAHFINMFSSAKGDHHRVHGGTVDDALWTIRGGSKIATKELRYGDSFKVLWASKGAKSCEGNDYDEAVATLPANWEWKRDLTYTFRVTWSKSEHTLRVFVNGHKALEAPWLTQVSPLKYVFLAKAADFNTWIGPIFSNLRIYGPPANK